MVVSRTNYPLSQSTPAIEYLDTDSPTHDDVVSFYELSLPVWQHKSDCPLCEMEEIIDDYRKNIQDEKAFNELKDSIVEVRVACD